MVLPLKADLLWLLMWINMFPDCIFHDQPTDCKTISHLLPNLGLQDSATSICDRHQALIFLLINNVSSSYWAEAVYQPLQQNQDDLLLYTPTVKNPRYLDLIMKIFLDFYLLPVIIILILACLCHVPSTSELTHPNTMCVEYRYSKFSSCISI